MSKSRATGSAQRRHSIGLASCQQLGYMCCRTLCVPKFVFGGPPRDWVAFLTRSRTETVFCKKCKSDKPVAQFSKAQCQEKNYSRWICLRPQGVVRGSHEHCRSDFNFHDYLSLTIYKHISVYVGYNIMSLMYVSLSISQYSLLDIYVFVWYVGVCV